MDLSKSMRDSIKFFCEGLHVQLAAKLFCLETFFMVYGDMYTSYKSGVHYIWPLKPKLSNRQFKMCTVNFVTVNIMHTLTFLN